MKTSKIKYVLLLITVSSMSILQSCLDFDPLDQLGGDSMWATKSDYEQFANNFYGWTRDFKSALDEVHSDQRSDLVTGSSYNQYSKGVNTIPTSDGNYTGNYDKIRRTNLLLQNAASYSIPSDITQYVGEAYFFRAYCYFDLLQIFGDVIIVKEPLDVTDPKLWSKQNDRSEVADFIIEDLGKAIDNLPSFAGYGRISKEGAQAFLSRVALYEGTWQKFRGNTERGKALLDIAAKAAKAVIDSKRFTLFGTTGLSAELGTSAQRYMFILEDVKSNPLGLKKTENKEYIFARCHDEILSPIGVNVTKGLLNNSNVWWITRKFANMYLCDNGLPIEYNGRTNEKFQGYAKKVSEFENRDNRMSNTLLKPGTKYWSNAVGNSRVSWDDSDLTYATTFNPTTGTCYANQKFATERFVADTKEGYDFPIIRYAEVLLNYAEAVYERDEKIGDSDLDISLNLVRCRINPNMPKLSNALVSDNGLNMQTEIRRERTIELFLEGFRADDLKRWKTAEKEMLQDMLGIKWSGTEYQTVNFSYGKDSEGCIIVEGGRKWEDKNYLYPLPSDQLQLNENLKQNPGWK